MKITHPVTRAAFGVAALAAIAISANWLVSLTPMGNRGADFTANRIHTLSDGTKAILGELDTPVVIRYYASRNTDYMPEDMKLHMRRVDDLLKEYASLSKDKLRIENLDPEPDTDAEDSANLDGITGQRIDDQNLYFGIAVSCLDKTSVLPFLNPREETMLEYQLSKAIAEVSTPVKPKVGVMSAMDLKGAPGNPMMGQRGSQPWVIYSQLKQSFDLVDVPMENPTLDPKEIKVLLLFHPAGITPETEFAIDQYLLGGGTVVACLDAFSVAAQMTGGGNPMMGMQGTPTTSTLPTLLSAWGVNYESGKVLADPAYATKLAGDRTGIAVLTLDKNAMPQNDSVITKDLESVTFFLPGAYTRTGGGVASNSLMRSTTGAGFVDAMQASQLDPKLTTTFRSSGTAYDLVTHLSGTFKTAFPDGKPGEKEAADADKDKEGDKKEGDASKPEEKKEEAKPQWLKESATPGNVFLIADVDAFYDRFAYNVQNFGGMQMASPINGNSSFLFNLMDQAVGSKHLIGSRSRSALRRPFTVVQKMEDDFNQKAGKKIEEFESKQKATMDKLNELQASRSRSSGPYLSPEQEAEIRKLRKEQVEYSKLIREQQKELRRQKDKLAGKITLLNVAAMPGLVILFGLVLFLQRRRSTRAR